MSDHCHEHLLFLKVDSVQGSDLAPVFENMSRSEKVSEIKLPLDLYVVTQTTDFSPPRGK